MRQDVYASKTFGKDIQTQYKHALHLLILSVCQDPHHLPQMGLQKLLSCCQLSVVKMNCFKTETAATEMRTLTLLYKCGNKKNLKLFGVSMVKLSWCGTLVFNWLLYTNVKTTNFCWTSWNNFTLQTLLATLLKRSAVCHCLRVASFGISVLWNVLEKFK